MAFARSLKAKVVDAEAAFQEEVASFKADVSAKVDAFVTSKIRAFKVECESRADGRHEDHSARFVFDATGGLRGLANHRLKVTCDSAVHQLSKKLVEQLHPLGFTKYRVELHAELESGQCWQITHESFVKVAPLETSLKESFSNSFSDFLDSLAGIRSATWVIKVSWADPPVHVPEATPERMDRDACTPLVRCTMCHQSAPGIVLQPCGHICCNRCNADVLGKACPSCHQLVLGTDWNDGSAKSSISIQAKKKMK